MSTSPPRKSREIGDVYDIQQKQLEIMVSIAEAQNALAKEVIEMKDRANAATVDETQLKSTAYIFGTGSAPPITYGCGACGVTNEAEALFCEECGVKL